MQLESESDTVPPIHITLDDIHSVQCQSCSLNEDFDSSFGPRHDAELILPIHLSIESHAVSSSTLTASRGSSVSLVVHLGKYFLSTQWPVSIINLLVQMIIWIHSTYGRSRCRGASQRGTRREVNYLQTGRIYCVFQSIDGSIPETSIEQHRPPSTLQSTTVERRSSAIISYRAQHGISSMGSETAKGETKEMDGRRRCNLVFSPTKDMGLN